MENWFPAICILLSFAKWKQKPVEGKQKNVFQGEDGHGTSVSVAASQWPETVL